MKIIFSRKGFDSALGARPSPVFDRTGDMVSLPVPHEGENVSYADIRYRDSDLGKLVEELSNYRVKPFASAHLDPDLRKEALPRLKDWRPLFGQAGVAQAHLRNHRVGRGDVFLFYGWFRKARWEGQRLAYVKGAPDMHVLFGWLQVEEVVPANYGCPPGLRWAAYHPHFRKVLSSEKQDNAVYVSRPLLQLPGESAGSIPGAGAFTAYSEDLCLTDLSDADHNPRSVWKLPKWFWTTCRDDRLSLHEDPDRWERRRDHVRLHTVARGQEFVLDAYKYRGAIPWLRWLLSTGLQAGLRP